MTILQSLILGVVEGVTEFLPVSSTGHLILVGSLLGLSSSDFLKSFEIIIQLGAIGAVLFFYWPAFLSRETCQKVAIAFLPTSIVGFLAYKFFRQYLLGNEGIVIWSLFIGGLVLIGFELAQRSRTKSRISSFSAISFKQAFSLGLFQSVAIIPGVSRSAATILGGLLMGIERRTIVEFSFLLAIPTMLAATGLDLAKNFNHFSTSQFLPLIIGLMTSFVVALASIKFLLRFIERYTFLPFGIYRVILALVFWQL